ncbi:MAG: hypothetical protein J7507_11970 [Pseudoxanthomonas sp.]|nr:hypothetical protein [Pseudoxanthomonas sp.]
MQQLALIRGVQIPVPVSGFDQADAARNVGDALQASGDLGEMVEEIAETASWLAWAAERNDLPAGARAALTKAARHAKRLDALLQAECEALGVE